MQRSSGQLTAECVTRSTPGFVSGGKYTRQDMVDLLAKQSYAAIKEPTWGLTERLKITSPMLCFAFWNLKSAEKEAIMLSERWIAEKKFDGCRIVICYHPDEGFTFFSRNVSVTDYLPVDYTETILLVTTDGQVCSPRDFAGKYNHAFVIDSEIVTDAKNLDTTIFSKAGVVTGTELNAVSAILALNVNDSHEVQRTQAKLRFEVFDIMRVDSTNVGSMPLEKRKTVLSRLMGVLAGFKLPFTEAKWVKGPAKEEFYHETTKSGGEGIVLKNLDMPYIETTSRPRTTQVKRKRSVGESLGADVDAFISGFVESDKEKGWAHLIGGLKVSVYLRDPDGKETEHWIGSVSSMPMTMREKMTETGEDSKPRLKKEFYGKVLVVNGQDIAPKSLRFMHCTCDWDRGIRSDKGEHECLMDRVFLESQVL